MIDLMLAKSWLRVDHDDEDFTIQTMIDQASSIVIDYLKKPVDEWDRHTLPRHVQAAILHVLKRVYDDRAGELEGGPLPQHVKDILRRERDPALA